MAGRSSRLRRKNLKIVRFSLPFSLALKLIRGDLDDPEHGDEATVGETWFYAELPMLMRNLNIHQIVSFWKESGEFTTHLEWDANRVRCHLYSQSSHANDRCTGPRFFPSQLSAGYCYG